MGSLFFNKNILFFLFLSFGFVLNSQVVYVKSSASGANNGTSWNNAYTNLKTAITNANSGDEIWVAKGTYNNGQISLKNNVTIYGGFPDVGNPNFASRDFVSNVTIISGGNANRVIYNSGTINNTAVLDGFTISDGVSSQGAGMYMRNASPTIRNCIFENNNSTNNGGALYLYNCDGEFSFCTMKNNSASNDGGGAYIRSGSDVVFTNCRFETNNSEDAGGVFIYGSNSSFTSCTIDNNTTSDDYAGVYIQSGNSSFVSCVISNNTSPSLGGGVVINNGAPSFSNCTIDNNVGDDNGAGIYLRNSASPTFTNCTISNNSMTGLNKYGGGMYITSTASPTITGCTFDGNSATHSGGAIFATSTAWTVPLDGNTFTNNVCTGSGGNTRGRGGAVYIEDAAPPITNNTFTSNTSTCTTVNTDCGCGGALYVRAQAVQIIGNDFTGNTASTSSSGNACGRGGAIYLYNSPSTLTNNTFSNNTGHFGGAVFTYNTTGFNISNCTFTNNNVTSYADNTGWGAALMSYGGGVSNVTSCTFSGGDADPGLYNSSGKGGAVCIDNGNDDEFYKCTFTSNNAKYGGAFYYDGTNSSKITNCLLFSNTAVNGGAIAARNNNDDNFYNFNNTIADNTATNGGAVYCENSSDMHFRNNIFWGNTATNGNQVYLLDNGSDPYFDNCDIQGGTAGFVNGSGTYMGGRYTPDASCDDQDPQFSDGVYHLTLITSPCIGTGDAGTAAGDFPLDQDYDGQKRVRGVVDIGAYETNNDPVFVTLPYPPLTDNPGPVSVTMDEDANPTAFSLTLSAADLDDEDLIWSILNPASNGTAGVAANTVAPNPQSNPITYTPNADYNGTDMFKVQVSDGTLTDVIQVDVTINSINDAPYFTTNPAVLSVKANQTWSYNIATNDVDHNLNTLTLTCTNKPAGMTFTAGANGTGVLSWTPTDGDVSPPTYTVVLRITDPDGAWEEQTFVLTVETRFIYVPADYPNVQQAVDAAVDGEDKIIVSAGTYPSFNTDGKTIEIEGDPANPANVIIDANFSGSCIVVDQGGSPVIDGFTLKNGTGQLGLPAPTTLHAPASGYYGGGILCFNSTPTFRNMIIEDNSLVVNNNHGGSGAGIYIGGGSIVLIEGTVSTFTVQNNSSTTYRGGGICIDNSDVTINKADIINNYAGDYGGGISVYNSDLDITNMNINGNTVDGKNGRGGGIYSHNSNVTKHNPMNISGNSASVSGNNEYTYN